MAVLDGETEWSGSALAPHYTLALEMIPMTKGTQMRRTVPEWVPNAVFYQIFPDRFRREPDSWDTDPTQPADRTPCGGNLAGIRAAIPYLQDLGITAVYLTPIFHAGSYHKYDTIDYFAIDPEFGTREAFDALVGELHERGMRIVLDGVFNHCSDRHPFFLDVVERGPSSTYWDWFTISGEHIVRDPQPNYTRWAGVPTMPEWNHRNPAVVDYLLSVVDNWIREAGIDGWRLDTTEYLPPDVVRAIYRTAREVSPDVYILGEVMGLGTPWFKHDAVDGVMHYKLWEAVSAFFAEERWDARTFAHSVLAHWHSYPEDANFGSYTLLSSHDRPRFLTQCNGDLARLHLAMAFQFTFPGPPAIYYGDEIGLEGGDDPDNRRCFPWDQATWNRELTADVRRWIALRRREPALRRGSIRFLETSGRFLSFERTLGDEAIVIGINADRQSDAMIQLPPGSWRALETETEHREQLAIPPRSSCTLKRLAEG